MRFLQTSDLHLNMIPDSDLPWGKDRANDIKNSLRKIIEKADTISADCLFFSGNIFHRPPLSRDLQELDTLFRRIPRTQVILISGSEDAVTENSALLSFSWADNVHWLLHSGEKLYFDEINAEITGISCPYEELPMELQRIQEMEAHSDSPLHDPIRVLLYHDSSREEEKSGYDFTEFDFDYIALGGRHQPLEDRAQCLVASGSPEPLTAEDTGEHGIFMGDISSITHKIQRLEFLPLSETRYISLNLTLSPQDKISELLPPLTENMNTAGRNNIFRIILDGKFNGNPVPEISNALRDYRIVEIQDRTESDYDFDALYREHPTDLMGYFIRAFLKPEESPEDLSYIEKQALHYGVHALLEIEEEKA